MSVCFIYDQYKIPLPVVYNYISCSLIFIFYMYMSHILHNFNTVL